MTNDPSSLSASTSAAHMLQEVMKQRANAPSLDTFVALSKVAIEGAFKLEAERAAQLGDALRNPVVAKSPALTRAVLLQLGVELPPEETV